MNAVTGRGSPDAACIELRLTSVAQLFHTLDPSPFREGDLSGEAAEYIRDSARELPRDAPLHLAVHLPPPEAASPEAGALGDTIRRTFASRAVAEAQDIRELFRQGRSALAVGLAILATALFLAVQVSGGGQAGPVSRVLQESLVIVGWVAVWRPAEIFPYDWLPLARRRDLFRRLARAIVTLRTDGA